MFDVSSFFGLPEIGYGNINISPNADVPRTSEPEKESFKGFESSVL